MQCLDGHISTCFNKDTHYLFMLCIVLMCELYHVVFIIVVQFILLLFDFFIRLLFDFCFHSILLLLYCSLFIVKKKKDSILILDCIPGISIPLYVKYLFSIIYASQINIIHQTALTLS